MTGSVEILLATHNSARFLRELVDSILGQTVTDFILTVRDDGSTDDTRDILASYDDPRIRLVPDHTPSGSARSNFFRLLLASTGDYLLFADADDVWLPHKVERTLERMNETQRRMGENTPILVHGDLIVANEDLSVRAGSLFRYEKLSPQRNALKNLLAQNNVTGCTVMVNRALRELVREEPAHTLMHDWWLALIAAAFGRIEVIDQPLLYYRQHGDNAVGAYDAADPGAALRKLADTGRVRSIYQAMFRQAGCFADTFHGRLTPQQEALCRAYASMEHKGKLGRIGCIIKHGFYKNTLVRNLGQWIKI